MFVIYATEIGETKIIKRVAKPRDFVKSWGQQKHKSCLIAIDPIMHFHCGA